MKKKSLTSVIILYNRVSGETTAPASLADEDTIWTAVEAQKALVSLGYRAELLEVTVDNITRLNEARGDVFLNLAEGIGSLPKSDYLVARELENLNRPFTGCSSEALHFTNDKIATKDLLVAHQLPTAAYQVFSSGDVSDFSLTLPVIAKPSREDSSLGISLDSVATNRVQLKQKVATLNKLYSDPILVEEYIDGRELNVTVIGYGDQALALPISEVVFGDWFSGKYKVVDFSAKWEEGTPAFQNSWGVAPAQIDEPTRQKVVDYALLAYKLTNCQGYARIDFRLGTDNVPYILEVNANPGVAPDSGAVRSAKAAGYSYEKFLELIITLARNHYDQEEVRLSRFASTFAFS